MPEDEKAKTIEGAKACPKCGHVGQEGLKQKAANGDGLVYTFICKNNLCIWFESGWVVQIKANGELAQRDTGNRNKQFNVLTDYEKTIAQRQIDEAKRLDSES